MGQYESKQKLEKITHSVEKIRKDVRNGKITANDVERIQEYLRQYSNDINLDKNVKLRRNDTYTLEQLIEITSKELDAVKDEVNLDAAAVHTNSFSRASSKNYSKQKRNSVKSIAKAVEDIRTQIRNGQVQNHEQFQADLVNYSQELSSKKGKKQEIDKVQKLISSVTQELFSKQPNDTPDNVSIRSSTNSLSRKSANTNSLTRKNENTNSLSRKSEKRSSIKEQEIRKETPKIASRNTNSFDDIENKLDFLKNDLTVAESNKDKSRLRFLAKSVQTLMTDLQLVNVKNQVLDEERKELLEKNLQRLYQQIEKVKRQISTESNITYLVELEKKQKRERCVQDLEELQKTLKDVSANLNSQNYQAEKENFVVYKNKVETIEDLDQEIIVKKAEISDKLMDIENALTRLEMEDRLNQAEWRHCQYKIDLKKFPLTTKHEAYKKHRQYLTQLREYINKIQEISQKVDEKKKYVLYNIDNNIAALEKKALENEEKQKKEEAKEGNTPTDKLLAACNAVPTDGSFEEIKNLLPLLTQAKTIIEQKINSLQYQMDTENSDTVLVRIKEKEIEPDAKNLVYAIDNVQKEVANLPSENNAKIVILDEDIIDKNPEDIMVLEITKKPEVIQSTAQLEKIQEELEALFDSIGNQRYTKETQFYKENKNKLESYRHQIEVSSNDDERFKKNLLKFVDDVLQHLESNLASRKSTTEDILVDIMSVSTRVNELGNKIQNGSQTAEGYESIKRSLQEHREYLRKLPISTNRTNLYKSREEIFLQIDRHLAKIEDLKTNDDNSVPEEEKRFNQDLRKLKEKVSRYSGTYKNVLYKTIENDLDKHLNRVEEIFKDPDVVVKVKKDIENSKMILEQKSNKDQHYNEVKRNVSEPGSKQLTEIRQNIQNVEKAMNRHRPLTKQELDKLDATLTLSVLALDNIKDEKHTKEKDKLYKEIHYYFDQLQELMVVSKSRPKVKNPQEKELSLEQQLAITVASIEQDLEKIKPEIMSFVGTETSPNFLHLDEILVRGTLKLDELNLDPASELYPLKKKLMREIHKFSDILDERINQTEEIEKLENDVKVMLMKIDSFNGYFGDPEYQFLDEQIIKLKVSLGKLHVNQELIDRRDACIRDVDSCMKKLKEAAKPRHDAFGGTLV